MRVRYNRRIARFKNLESGEKPILFVRTIATTDEIAEVPDRRAHIASTLGHEEVDKRAKRCPCQSRLPSVVSAGFSKSWRAVGSEESCFAHCEFVPLGVARAVHGCTSSNVTRGSIAENRAEIGVV